MEHKVREIFGPSSESLVVIDIGAFVGSVSQAFADWYQNATVYAVEACPKNFNVLCKRTRDDKRIRTIHAAVCGRDGVVSFCTVSDPKCQKTHKGTSSRSNSIYKSPAKRFEGMRRVDIKSYTVDSLCAEFGINHINILKINSEGAEYSTFRKNSKFLRFTDLIAVQMHGRKLVKNYFQLRKDIRDVLKRRFNLAWTSGPIKSRGHIDQIWVRK